VIPNHILNGLGPDECVAILSCRGELHFLVHAVTDGPDVIATHATREGAEILATHLRDKNAILAFVSDRERDVGGEG
jgi:hypothetical protein